MAERPFLSRWSRLKQEARTQAPGRRGGAAPVIQDDRAEETRQAALPPEAPAQQQAVQPARSDQQPQEAAFDADSLPDIDSLTVESDFTQFLRKEVPKTLQRRALRKLWTSDPVFACLDGLNDYEEDFTDAATVIEGMKSSYQVGRGFLTDEELAENHSVYTASRQARIDAEEAEAAAEQDGSEVESSSPETDGAPEQGEPEKAPEQATAAVADEETSPEGVATEQESEDKSDNRS
ncbi:DUF3306 domain-containing protein [Oceanibaculum indicum]|uniref:DUF3306 domain-containing protein n=1 Tax=Oceanibaculum indicum P24 TaxID=1207063 RepID=K2KMK3_9PROT|nr:DUF3306 domain-containing protein [Oceanibaculum indicum]EKE78700.1 hypothetical protein P24_00075 [Oceanibaculum indicum P24]